jgi:hypothetical protein
VVRSIGQLLGLPPLSQYDSAAAPLWNAFSNRAIATPYAALPNTWSLDEMNPTAYRSPIAPGDFAVADRADEVLLNREIWESVHPRSAPPPVRRAWVVREPGR